MNIKDICLVKKSMLIAVLFAMLFASANVLAANITINRDHGVMAGSIVIDGKIEAGDYWIFLEKVVEAGIKKGSVHISSPGGNLKEAIKIGQLIRALHFVTTGPLGDSKSGPVCGDEVEYCGCESACFLIYMSGIRRTGCLLGVHRSFIDHDRLKDMSAKKAMAYSKKAREMGEKHILEMGGSRDLVDKISNISSSEIVYLDRKYIDENVSGYSKDIEEFYMSRCGNVEIHTKEYYAMSKSEQSELDRKYFERINCEKHLGNSTRQELFYKTIIPELIKENINPVEGIFSRIEYVENIDFTYFLNRSAVEFFEYLKLFGFGNNENIKNTELKDQYLRMWTKNIDIITDSNGNLYKIDFKIFDTASDNDDWGGYKGPLIYGVNHTSSLDDLINKFGKPVEFVSNKHFAEIATFNVNGIEVIATFEPSGALMRSFEIRKLQ